MKLLKTVFIAICCLGFSLSLSAEEETKKFKKVSIKCHNNLKKDFDNNGGKSYKEWRERSRNFCKDKCTADKKKCGIKKIQVEKLKNKKKKDFKKPSDIIVDKKKMAYRAVLFTCKNVKTIFKEFDKECKMSKAAWKKYATAYCNKIVDEKDASLSKYSVSKPCSKADSSEEESDEGKTIDK